MVDQATDLRFILKAGIYGLEEPTKPDQAAPKSYVDGRSGNKIRVLDTSSEVVDIGKDDGDTLFVIAARPVTLVFPKNADIEADEDKIPNGMRVAVYLYKESHILNVQGELEPELETNQISGEGETVAFIYLEKDDIWLVFGHTDLTAVQPLPPAGDVRLVFYRVNHQKGIYTDPDTGYLWLVPDGMGVVGDDEPSIGPEGSGATTEDGRLVLLYKRLHTNTTKFTDTLPAGTPDNDWNSRRAMVVPNFGGALLMMSKANAGMELKTIESGSGDIYPALPVTLMVSMGVRE